MTDYKTFETPHGRVHVKRCQWAIKPTYCFAWADKNQWIGVAVRDDRLWYRPVGYLHTPGNVKRTIPEVAEFFAESPDPDAMAKVEAL